MVKRVLMVSYFFAPSRSVGARRPISFYEHLPAFGWEPHVLTVMPAVGESGPAMPNVVRTNYASPWKWLERRRAASVQDGPGDHGWSLRQAAHSSPQRTRAYSLLRHVLPMSSVRMPDASLGWYPYAVRAGAKLLQSAPYDVIWSTSGPPTAHLIAGTLHKRTGIPWVADYRDPWSLNFQELRLPPFQRMEEQLERSTLAHASRIVTASVGFAELLSGLHQRDVDVIYNGFDDLPSTPDNSERAGEFTIRYTGALYPEMDDINTFLRAIAQAQSTRPDFRPAVELYGPELDWVARRVDDHGLSETVRCLVPVPRPEALALQQSATLLLLFGRSRPGLPGVLPTKAFEYMHTGRPVLEVGPEDAESASIIAQCGAGMTLIDPARIARRLIDWWDEFLRTDRVSWSTDMSQVNGFSRRAQAARLAHLLEHTLATYSTPKLAQIPIGCDQIMCSDSATSPAEALEYRPLTPREKLARVATFGFSEQNFLGQPWIPSLLEIAPNRLKRRLALELLAMSPHYFKRSKRYTNLPRMEVLEAEHQRNVHSRRTICEQLLSPYLSPDMDVLDFGCGPGNLAYQVATRVKSVTAVDLSCGAIACAKVLNGADNVTYLVNDGISLISLDPSHTDLIYSFAVVQHLSDALFKGFLGEFYRVLKPGGRVVCHIALDDGDQPTPSPVAVDNILRRAEKTFELRMEFRPFTQICQMIQVAGFLNLTVAPIGRISDIDDDIANQHLFIFEKPL